MIYLRQFRKISVRWFVKGCESLYKFIDQLNNKNHTLKFNLYKFIEQSSTASLLESSKANPLNFEQTDRMSTCNKNFFYIKNEIQ